MTTHDFGGILENYGVILSQEQQRQFAQYFSLLVEWNRKINLTAVIDRSGVYSKHFFDSLAPFLFGLLTDEKYLKLVDVGAGAGFPSIPLKIILPDLDVTIVDSLNKRVVFLRYLTEQLQIQGVHFYHERAENFGQDPRFREQYDVVLARAVARLDILSELALPLIKKGGKLIAFKATQTKQEVAGAQRAIVVLGGKFVQKHGYKLPNSEEERFLVVVEKCKETPKKYPRKPGLPNKKPIK